MLTFRLVRVQTLDRFARLGANRRFMRLVGVRVASQGADATVQVGMAGYVLLNPQNQPNAWAIAGVIGVVMLPFSIVGPVVSPLLDRFWRQRTAITCDLARTVISILIAAMVATRFTDGLWLAVLYCLILTVLSLNRLQIAALTAGIPHIVSGRQLLDASSVIPVIGPVCALVFGALSAAIRLLTDLHLPSHICDAMIFGLAAVLFALSILGTARFSRDDFGPDRRIDSLSLGRIVAGIKEAGRHIRCRHHLATAFALLITAKTCYGMLMTTMVVFYKNGTTGTDTRTGIILMSIWFACSGAGYALSGVVAVPLSSAIGVRVTVIAALVISAGFQLFPAGTFTHLGLCLSGFVLGICTQTIKICTDTLVQAHCDEHRLGRVLVLYDIVNNLGLVIGALIAAALLPASGHSLGLFGLIAAIFVLTATVFTLTSRTNHRSFNKGTALHP